MNELIERLAREAGLHDYPLLPPKAAVARFAALVAEQCAAVADDTDAGYGDGNCTAAGSAIRSKFPMPKG